MKTPSSLLPPDLAEQAASGKVRIIQELVPGKQITLAHIIASPDPVLYQKLGLDPTVDYSRAAIGMITLSPAETRLSLLTLNIPCSLSFCSISPSARRVP